MKKLTVNKSQVAALTADQLKSITGGAGGGIVSGTGTPTTPKR